MSRSGGARDLPEGSSAPPSRAQLATDTHVLNALRAAPAARAASARGVVRLLLNACLGALLLGSCFPPDFEIEPDDNQPIRIDKSLLTINPDQFHDLSGCPPRELLFDVATAISDPDGDAIQTVWLVDYQKNAGAPPDAVGFLRFSFDPCESSKITPGKVTTIELFVLDRRPQSFDDADEAKTLVDPETTTDSVVWFIGVDDLSCCGELQ